MNTRGQGRRDREAHGPRSPVAPLQRAVPRCCWPCSWRVPRWCPTRPRLTPAWKVLWCTDLPECPTRERGARPVTARSRALGPVERRCDPEEGDSGRRGPVAQARRATPCPTKCFRTCEPWPSAPTHDRDIHDTDNCTSSARSSSSRLPIQLSPAPVTDAASLRLAVNKSATRSSTVPSVMMRCTVTALV